MSHDSQDCFGEKGKAEELNKTMLLEVLGLRPPVPRMRHLALGPVGSW